MFDSNVINREIALAVCGKLLGRGVSREVFECTVNPDLVVKIEDKSGSFSNVSEWQMWNNHLSEHKWAADFFAPCRHISSCGSVFFMERTTPPRNYPDWVPVYWTDLKLTNFGMIGDRLVCHDYGISLIPDIGLDYKKPRFKNARWWDLDDKFVT